MDLVQYDKQSGIIRVMVGDVVFGLTGCSMPGKGIEQGTDMMFA